uniref:Uncharacterized protein n=1 Tax=Hyaloperonospora arabidopsidis (strain Emoy2) TaxID=559515 RepID=M4B254_HYAAE
MKRRKRRTESPVYLARSLDREGGRAERRWTQRHPHGPLLKCRGLPTLELRSAAMAKPRLRLRWRRLYTLI